MTGKEQATGKVGEKYAASALSMLGIEQLERIGTPIKAIASDKPGLFRVIWGEKVIADWRGILPGGRSVLAEVKTILNRNLHYSDLRPHQHAGLTEHSALGGLSLLVWVHGQYEVYIMEWPIPGFEPGHGLTPAQAEKLTVKPANFHSICNP